MLAVLIFLGLIAALYLIATKKEPPTIEDPATGLIAGDRAPPNDGNTQTSLFVNTRFAGELIEPTDKRITKTLAIKLYEQTLRQAKPGKAEKLYKYFAKGFAGSIDTHYGMLEQLTPSWQLEDLRENIDGLKTELSDELEDEEGFEIDHERIKWLREKIKLHSEELRELRAIAQKYKNRDLRFFLANELNSLIHSEEREDFEIIAQKTHDFWQKKAPNQPHKT